jgi:hypothetical protein
VDAVKIKAWLHQQTAFDTNEATSQINFMATPFPPLPRVKNEASFKGAVQNGKIVQTDSTAFAPKQPQVELPV